MTSETENKNSEKNLQEIQSLEQSLQGVLMEKQAIQLEMSETESGLNEIENSGEDVYRVIGQIMIKSDKKKMKEDLAKKKNFLEIKLKQMEDYESSIMKKIESLRNEIV